MLKLYKPEDWTKKNKKEGMRELTGGPIEEEDAPAKNNKNLPPPGFKPQAKFETAPTKPPPKTALTNPPPKPEEKQKRVK